MIDLKELDFDALGNIQGLDIPEYNKITRDDDLTVIKAKRAAQLKQLEELNKNK